MWLTAVDPSSVSYYGSGGRIRVVLEDVMHFLGVLPFSLLSVSRRDREFLCLVDLMFAISSAVAEEVVPVLRGGLSLGQKCPPILELQSKVRFRLSH